MSELGRLAYEAYFRQSAIDFPGTEPTVLWPELPEVTRGLWDAAADAVAQAQIEVDLNSGIAPGGF